MTTTTSGFAFPAIAFFFFCSSSSSFISSALAYEVVELTPDNFKNQVGRDQHALVEFYAPWCGHCKKLAPEYEKLAEQFKKEKSVLIAKVDCDKHKSFCKKFDLNGYPTIRWFPKGSLKPEEYIGKPTAENIAEYVNAQAGTKVKIVTPPSSVVVLTSDNFNKVVLDETKDVLVKFYASWCGHCKTLAPIYEKVATAFKLEEDVVIANCDADKYRELTENYGITGFPTLKFFPKGNKAGEDYSGARELSHFVAFINEKSGTNRDADGKLTSKAGIIESLDNLVKKFISVSGEEKKKVYSLMKEEVDKLTDTSARHGKIYLKAAKSSMDKGQDYAKKEIERISRIASSKTISDTKSDEFAVKKNILSTFT